MKLKSGQAQSILNALVLTKGAKLPVKTAYWLARTAIQLEPEVKAFETARTGLLERYGKKDKKKELIVREDGQVEFADANGFKIAFEELSDQEFEIKMDPLPLDRFQDPDGEMMIAIESMVGLLPLIEEPDTAEKK